MSDTDHDAESLQRLRRRAVVRLVGAQPVADATGALAVLHRLASSPATAADALALLHELQVHQVELEMRAEELRESRLELEAALQRQIDLYDAQPVACLTIDGRLAVDELNLRAAALLGLPRAEAYGVGLDAFLAPPGGHMLRELVAATLAGRAVGAVRLPWTGGEGGPRSLRARLGPAPQGARVLLVLDDAP